jgi:hypothetical protein
VASCVVWLLLDDDGVVRWGQIRPATRETLRSWLGEHCPAGDGEFSLEGCTGWRYISEELAAAGLGVMIPAGTLVIANTGAANRDPAVFDDPDRLDITRPDAPAIQTFGAGAHYCLGHHLRNQGRRA